ncbi:MAG: amino acid adenylation domain-containing protein [Clostridiales bacterium]|nr:amino acid adenylation domain-containing protein [Clostridiales bacterium]
MNTGDFILLHVLDVFKAVLDNELIEPHDDFFTEGGDSLKAGRATYEINEKLQVDIKTSAFFDHRTAAELAAHISSVGKKEVEHIGKVEEKGWYPLSFSQSRLYVLYQLEKTMLNYNLPQVCIIEGFFDLGKAHEAFAAIIDRHENLRSSFHLVDGQPCMKIHEKVDFEFEHYEAVSWAWDSIAKEFVRPFDLERAPLMRIGIAKLSGNRTALLFDTHHIVSDGTSMNILIGDFTRLYSGQLLSPLEIQYKDYSEWQRAQKARNLFEGMKSYWVEKYADGAPVLNLPTDFIRPQPRSFAGACLRFDIGGELTAELKKMVRESGVTLYSVLLAAFFILLHKYSGQDDIVIGCAVAGRNHRQLENIIGMFVNSLPVRSALRESKEAGEYVSELCAELGKMFDFQGYPIEEIIENIRARREGGRNPLFDVMFVLQNMESVDILIEGATVEAHEIDTATANVDLTLEAREKGGNISFKLEYSTELFEKAAIERMVGHYINILTEVSSGQGKTIGGLDILSESEKTALLSDFNAPGENYSSLPIADVFETVAKSCRDRVALEFGDELLTYGQFNEKVNGFANSLIQMGVRPGNRVALFFERSIDMVICMFAALKAGAVYVPIEPGYPAERIRFIANDSEASCLIFHDRTSFVKDVEGIDVETMVSFEDLAKIRPAPSLAGRPGCSGKDGVYMMYTSGSTGNPKGTVITSENIARVVHNTNYISISSQDVLLQLSSYAFDGSVFDIFGALLNGARLVLIGKDSILDVDVLAETIVDKRITVFFVTTALFNVLADYKIDSLAGVRTIIFGGESANVSLVKKAFAFLGPGRIVHAYGPTENTTFSTVYPVDSLAENADTVPIGKPISGTKAYVLDKNSGLLPIGVPGELCLAGSGLSSGYVNRPDLTNEKFIDNPFCPDSKMYKTGDVVKWDSCGNLVFLGRVDNQVKIRGFRVELDEVSSKIAQDARIRDVFVCLKEGNNNKQLHAYLVAAPDFPVGELKLALLSQLPEYMVPLSYTVLDKFPINANGKIDRSKLPEPAIGQLSAAEPPESLVQSSIGSIWKSVLGVEGIGLDDNFFDIGGNSILLIQMHAQINLLYPDKVKITDIFANPTIRQMAFFLEGEGGAGAAVTMPSISFPAEYYSNSHSRSMASIFSFCIDKGTVQGLNKVALQQSVSVEHLLVSLYMSLVSVLSKQQSVLIHYSDGRSSIRTIERCFSNDEDILGCAEYIEANIDSLPSFGLEKLSALNKKTEGNGTSILIEYRKTQGRHVSFSAYYDMTVAISRLEEEIEIISESNSTLDKHKMKIVDQLYLQLIRKFIVWYSKERGF